MAPETTFGSWGLLPRWCLQSVSQVFILLTFLHTRLYTQGMYKYAAVVSQVPGGLSFSPAPTAEKVNCVDPSLY